MFVTGDPHGNFKPIIQSYQQEMISKGSTLVVLGDAGINYYGGTRDTMLKEALAACDITFFCVHGNHENRPSNVFGYTTMTWNGGKVYYEVEYPNILFPADGEVFKINGHTVLVIGGAYSVDKFYRLGMGYHWWADEQPNDQIKQHTIDNLEKVNWCVDYVFSHTCPLKYEPIEVFLPMIDQSTVDKTTEIWLDDIEDRLTYKQWLCVHYHTEKIIDKMRFLYKDIIEIA